MADDHGLLRQGMRLLLNTTFPGCTVIEAGTLDAAVAALRAAVTDLLLLDLDMPGMSGVASIHALHARFPALKIAVVSGSNDQQMVVEGLAAGANGYVLKEEKVEEVAGAVRSILEGYNYVSVSVAATLDEASRPYLMRPAMFTSRQQDVLRQLTLGRSNKEIARALGLGEGTVKIHLAAIFRLLGARNRTEAVVLAGQLKV